MDRVLSPGYVDGCGLDLFGEVCRRDLEGMVAKRKDSVYIGGEERQSAWLKIRNPRYSQWEGRQELFKRVASAGKL